MQPHLRNVTLAFGDLIAEPGEPVGNVYFPFTGWKVGEMIETAMVGRDGVSGSGGQKPAAARAPSQSASGRRGPIGYPPRNRVILIRTVAVSTLSAHCGGAAAAQGAYWMASVVTGGSRFLNCVR